MQALKSMVSAVVLGTLLFAAPTLRADEAKDHGHGHKGWHWDKFDRLKKQLDLSDDQVERLRDAEKGQREKGKLLRDKTKADEAALAVLVDEKASEDDLKAGLKALEQDHQSFQASVQKRLNLYKEVLSPLQQAKLVVLLSDHHGHGFGGHGGHGGWDGGHGGWGGPHPGWDKGQGGDGGGMTHRDRSDAPDKDGGADPSGD